MNWWIDDELMNWLNWTCFVKWTSARERALRGGYILLCFACLLLYISISNTSANTSCLLSLLLYIAIFAILAACDNSTLFWVYSRKIAQNGSGWAKLAFVTILATSDASSGVDRRGDELCVALGRTCAGSCAEFDGTLIEVVSLAPFKVEWRLKGVVLVRSY